MSKKKIEIHGFDDQYLFQKASLNLLGKMRTLGNLCAEIFLLLFLENVQFGQAEKIEQSFPSNKSLDCR